MAQMLMPLQGFAVFVRNELRRFFEEGSKTATGAAQLATQFARQNAAIAAIRAENEQNENVLDQRLRHVESENARLRGEVQQLRELSTESQHQLEEMSRVFTRTMAEKGPANFQENSGQIADCLQRTLALC